MVQIQGLRFRNEEFSVYRVLRRLRAFVSPEP